MDYNNIYWMGNGKYQKEYDELVNIAKNLGMYVQG